MEAEKVTGQYEPTCIIPEGCPVAAYTPTLESFMITSICTVILGVLICIIALKIGLQKSFYIVGGAILVNSITIYLYSILPTMSLDSTGVLLTYVVGYIVLAIPYVILTLLFTSTKDFKFVH